MPIRGLTALFSCGYNASIDLWRPSAQTAIRLQPLYKSCSKIRTAWHYHQNLLINEPIFRSYRLLIGQETIEYQGPPRVFSSSRSDNAIKNAKGVPFAHFQKILSKIINYLFFYFWAPSLKCPPSLNGPPPVPRHPHIIYAPLRQQISVQFQFMVLDFWKHSVEELNKLPKTVNRNHYHPSVKELVMKCSYWPVCYLIMFCYLTSWVS